MLGSTTSKLEMIWSSVDRSGSSLYEKQFHLCRFLVIGHHLKNFSKQKNYSIYLVSACCSSAFASSKSSSDSELSSPSLLGKSEHSSVDFTSAILSKCNSEKFKYWSFHVNKNIEQVIHVNSILPKAVLIASWSTIVCLLCCETFLEYCWASFSSLHRWHIPW